MRAALSQVVDIYCNNRGAEGQNRTVDTSLFRATANLYNSTLTRFNLTYQYTVNQLVT